MKEERHYAFLQKKKDSMVVKKNGIDTLHIL